MNVWDLIEKSMTDFCSALQFSSLDKHFNRTVYFLAKKSINRLKLNPIPIKFGSKTIASAMAFPTPFFHFFGNSKVRQVFLLSDIIKYLID